MCGRINAFQQGTPDAFRFANIRNLEEIYIDGVSLTHGAAGSRQHIWSFVVAHFEVDHSSNPVPRTSLACPCTNTDFNWPHQIPSFVGENYFCESGRNFADNTGPFDAIYADDPLWDGEGCVATSTCCQFNNPPWFCMTLPQPTTNDIELRICFDSDNTVDEGAFIHLVDMFVM